MTQFSLTLGWTSRTSTVTYMYKWETQRKWWLQFCWLWSHDRKMVLICVLRYTCIMIKTWSEYNTSSFFVCLCIIKNLKRHNTTIWLMEYSEPAYWILHYTVCPFSYQWGVLYINPVGCGIHLPCLSKLWLHARRWRYGQPLRQKIPFLERPAGKTPRLLKVTSHLSCLREQS